MRLEVAELKIRGIDIFKKEGFVALSSAPIACTHDLSTTIPAAINGDDLVSYWNPVNDEPSHKFCKVMGLKISNKDFFSRDRGIFMEDGFALLPAEDGGKRRAFFPDLVKVRLFTSYGRVGSMNPTSPFIGKTNSLSGQLRYQPEDQARFVNLVLTLYKRVHEISFTYLRYNDIELPPMFGGLSWMGGRTEAELLRDQPDLIHGIYNLLERPLSELLDFKFKFHRLITHGRQLSHEDFILRTYLIGLDLEPVDYVDGENPGQLYTVESLLRTMLADENFDKKLVLKDIRGPATGRNVKWQDVVILIRSYFDLIPLSRVIDRACRAIGIQDLLRGPDTLGPERVEALQEYRTRSRRQSRHLRSLGRRYPTAIPFNSAGKPS